MVGAAYLVLASLLILGWFYNLWTSSGRHHKRLPIAIHLIWVSVALIYIFFGTDMVA